MLAYLYMLQLTTQNLIRVYMASQWRVSKLVFPPVKT